MHVRQQKASLLLGCVPCRSELGKSRKESFIALICLPYLGSWRGLPPPVGLVWRGGGLTKEGPGRSSSTMSVL